MANRLQPLIDIRDPDCANCKLSQTADTVCDLGWGKLTSDIMVVCKMPNSTAWQKELELELEEMGLDLGNVFFASALKCRTFEQDASNADIKACRSYLEDEIKLIKPKWILAMGNEALLATTGRSGIMKYRGRIHERPDGIEVIPTISPASVKRNPGQRPGYMADLRLFVNKTKGITGGLKKPHYSVIDTREKLDKLKQVLKVVDDFNFDIETVSDYYKPDGKIVSLSATCILSTSSGPKSFVFALPLYHPESPWRRKWKAVLQYLRPELKALKNVTAHNGSYDVKWMRWLGIRVKLTFDPMLGLHLLNENIQKGLKPAAMARLGVEPWGIDTRNLLDKPLDDILEYNVLDTWYMYHLKQQVAEELKSQPKLNKLFKHVMVAGANDLVDSEIRGIWIDVDRLRDRTPVVEKKLKEIEDKIIVEAGLGGGRDNLFMPGSVPDSVAVPDWPVLKVLKTRGPVYHEPNFNASKFARWMLFEHLGLPVLERGKEKPNGSPGDPSMAEGVMLALKDKHPVVALMLERVEYQKIMSSFFGPYAELYDEDHRIHTNFKMAGTVTGRLSSGKNDEDKISVSKGKMRGVNLQQVPRNPLVRGVFGAPPGWTFVESDYSQIELRIAAYLSRDRTMLQLYKMGADIHRATAANVLGIPESQVTKDDRKKAKAVNFGFVYGMGWRKFIQTAFEKYNAIFTEEEARAVREAFFQHFDGLLPWHARQRRLVNKYGRVESPLGRIRHLPDIYSPDQGVRAEAERQAINSPVQGFGSDLAVLSMVAINKKFRKRGIQAHCVGLVHDAINYEIRDDYLAEALPIIKDTMQDMGLVEKKFDLHVDVPIVADVAVGRWWGDKVELTEEQVYDWRGMDALAA